MSITYGSEKTGKYYDTAPPSYSEIDEKKPLIPKGQRDGIKQVFGMRRSSFLLSLYLVFYGVYLTTGGLVFAVLEAPGEEEFRLFVLESRNNFIKKNPCVEDAALEDLIEVIIQANNRGVSAARNVSGEPNWSLGQSIFFSSSVLTTIGYGHVTPLSRAGKCFCIVYATLGIPLTMMLLTALVDRLMIPSARFLAYLNSKLGHLYQPFNIRLIHLLFIGSMLLIFFWLIPAAVFDYLEPEWDYFDSLYYCFISLTTIGLGDYIPGDSVNQPLRPLYKLLTTGYLLIGLTFLIFTITVFYAIPQLNFGLFFLLEADEDDFFIFDSEKARLQVPGAKSPKYTEQQENKSTVVKIKARRSDSPSPEETNPAHFFP